MKRALAVLGLFALALNPRPRVIPRPKSGQGPFRLRPGFGQCRGGHGHSGLRTLDRVDRALRLQRGERGHRQLDMGRAEVTGSRNLARANRLQRTQ
jgi:hypothetical protein